MTKKENWFEVDKEGLKSLQLGKPKTYVVRELIQNAIDEDITECKVAIEYSNGRIAVIVSDNSKIGFRDLKDAYTLFGDTYKRRDPEKRGRFNLGEKQAFSVCDRAKIRTTKGEIVFDKKGRTENKKNKTQIGTIVSVELKGKMSECNEMIEFAKTLIVSPKINYLVNDFVVIPKHIDSVFSASLMTEIADLEEGHPIKKVIRKTEIQLLKEDKSYIYEMGIPITEIECPYSINVMQKIPLGTDRETIHHKFLSDLFAEVLNKTFEKFNEDNASEVWINTALSNKRINSQAIQQIIKQRYGDRVLVANTFDKNSIDEAISNGYKVIAGAEFAKDVWSKIRENNLIQSTSDLFGTNFVNAETIKPNQKQIEVMEYAKRIAKRLLGFDIGVSFVKGGYNMVAAQYGTRHLTFNVSRLNGNFFENPISEETTDLILHELGHEAGNHTEESYHRLITKLGAKLTMLALKEPEFFKLEEVSN